ncbi:hypothetical protein AB4305_06955 [Nocardia sp. 2YAB30]
MPIVSAELQFAANLGAVDLSLPADAVRTFETVVPCELGLPGDFIAECDRSPFASDRQPSRRPLWAQR